MSNFQVDISKFF